MFSLLTAAKSSLSDDQETALVRILCASIERGVGKLATGRPDKFKVRGLRTAHCIAWLVACGLYMQRVARLFKLDFIPTIPLMDGK